VTRRPTRPRTSRHRWPIAALLVAVGIAVTAAVTGTASGASRVSPLPQAEATVGAPVAPSPGAGVAAAATPLPDPPGSTTRVSTTGAGGEADGASGGVTSLVAASNPDQAISADARWVVFVSAATQLIAGEPHPAGGLFLRDRKLGTTTAVPWLDGGPFPAGITAAEPAISSNGTVVAFTAIVTSRASTRILPTRTDTPFVFAWEQGAPAPDIVSMDATGRPTPGYQPSISGDGLSVAYTRWSVATAPPVLSNLRSDGFPGDGQFYIFGPSAPCTPHSATIAVTATDPDDAVTGVTLFYQPNGGSVLTKPMEPVGGDTWQTTIVAADAWASGRIEYRVEARDAQGNLATLANARPYLLTKGDCIL
jgi:hypothetical protein